MTARPTVVLKVGMGATPAVGIDVASSTVMGRSLLRSVTTSRGRTRVLDNVAPGQMTAEFDNSGAEFNPFTTIGPFTSGGVTQLRPGAWIQLAATAGVLGASVVPIWSGFVTDMPITPAELDAETATWQCDEALVALARVNPTALAAAVGDSELTGARLNRIATNSSWPVTTSVFPPFGASRAIDAGTVNCQPTVLGANSLTEAQTVNLTERGDFFTNAAGQLVFHNRGYRFVQRNGSANAIFGDGGGSEIPWVPMSNVIGNNLDLYVNSAHIAGSGLTPQVSTVAGPFVSDYSQVALYLRSDAEALSYANFMTSTYSAGDPRIEQITVQLMDDDTNWATVLGLEQGMWVTLKWRPNWLNGAVIQRECFIESIAHSIPAEGTAPWEITFGLGDATKYAGPWWVLDDAVFGKLDSGNKIIF